MKKSEGHGWMCCCCHGRGFAVLLIIFGGFFLLRDLEVIPSGISFWAVALLGFGVYILMNKNRKTC